MQHFCICCTEKGLPGVHKRKHSFTLLENTEIQEQHCNVAAYCRLGLTSDASTSSAKLVILTKKRVHFIWLPIMAMYPLCTRGIIVLVCQKTFIKFEATIFPNIAK